MSWLEEYYETIEKSSLNNNTLYSLQELNLLNKIIFNFILKEKKDFVWSAITYKREEIITSDFIYNEDFTDNKELENKDFISKQLKLSNWLNSKINSNEAFSFTDFIISDKYNPKRKTITIKSDFLISLFKSVNIGKREVNTQLCEDLLTEISSYSESYKNKFLIEFQDISLPTDFNFTKLLPFFIIYYLFSTLGQKIFNYHFIFVKPIFYQNFRSLYVLCSINQEVEYIPLLTLMLFHLFNGDISAELFMKEAENRRHAIKSAIAAIMARNMSHNLGSHVLYYLKTILSEQPKMMEYYLHELEENVDHLTLKVVKGFKERIQIYETDEENISTPFLLGLGKFLGYLQERQDFIATIAGDSIPYFGTVNFKDFIYDELNPDLRIERHINLESKYKIKNILLDYIARSEGYRRDNIHICYKSFNGIPNETNRLDFNELRNINIDLPGGILGRQAIFSIFENILRNATKHNEVSNKGNKQLYIVINIDRLPESHKFYQDYYKVLIYDKNKNLDVDLLKRLNIYIEDNLIDEIGKIKPENKGLKEMRISSAWMRNLNITDNNMEFNALPVFKAVAVKEDGKVIELKFDKEGKILGFKNYREDRANLGYEFYLPLTKKMIFVIEKREDTSIKDDFLKNKDFRIVTFDEYKMINTNFNLVLYDNEFSMAKKEVIKQLSPTKCLGTNIKEVENIIRIRKVIGFDSDNGKSDKREENINELYVYFIDKWMKENGFILKNSNNYILIADSTEYKKDNKNEELIYIDEKDIGTDKDKLKYNKNDQIILFKQHNDTKKVFEIFMKNPLYKKIQFIEGISGHNSTDRLIRRENHNREWVQKLQISALTKILIIDERIFITDSKIGSVIYLDYNFDELYEHISSKKVFECFITDREPFFKKYAKKEYDAIVNLIREKESYNEDVHKELVKNEFISASNKLKKYIWKVSFKTKELSEARIKKEINEKKNITVYNLNFLTNKIEVFGIDQKEMSIGIEMEISLPRDKIKNKEEKYHFVLVHQGVLDKWYDFFRGKLLKEDKVDKREILEQEKTEKEIAFQKFKDIFKAEFKYIIHSGTSKPMFLPKDTAFNQFSSVNIAYSDCKYSLTELLYSARVEMKKD